MRQIISSIALVCFTTTLMHAQLNISCNSRELCDWDGNTASSCEESEESSLFKINGDETMFEHTTPTIKSAYYIKSKKKAGRVTTLKVTSDVGNEYTFTIDLPNMVVRAVGKAVGEGRVVKFNIKRSWTEGGSDEDTEEPAATAPVTSGDKNGPCPSGAASNDFAQGDKVKIVGISLDDAYIGDAKSIVGLSATIGTDFSHKEGCWYGGNLVCSDGTTRYFFRVAIAASSKKLAATKTDPNGACPSGAVSGTVFNEGDNVRIVGISKDDAYVSDASSIVGLSATVGTEFSYKEDCWYGGNLVCSDGTTRYFYRVAIAGNAAKTKKSGCPSDAATGTSFPKGSRVTVVGISPEDSYYKDGDRLIGKTYIVGDDFRYSEGCYYVGNLKPVDGGSNYFFYRVAIKSAR